MCRFVESASQQTRENETLFKMQKKTTSKQINLIKKE